MTEKDDIEAKLSKLFDAQIDELSSKQFSSMVMKEIEKKTMLRKLILSGLAFIILFVATVLTHFSGMEIASYVSLSNQHISILGLIALTMILSLVVIDE